MKNVIVIPALYQHAKRDISSLHGALATVQVDLELNHPSFRCVQRGDEVELEVIDENRIIRLAYVMNKFVAYIKNRFDS